MNGVDYNILCYATATDTHPTEAYYTYSTLKEAGETAARMVDGGAWYKCSVEATVLSTRKRTIVYTFVTDEKGGHLMR